MSEKSYFHWSNRCSSKSDFDGIEMNLIGGWSDLAAYYSGSDGNVWTYHIISRNWTNNGPVNEFKERFKGRMRGELL